MCLLVTKTDDEEFEILLLKVTKLENKKVKMDGDSLLWKLSDNRIHFMSFKNPVEALEIRLEALTKQEVSKLELFYNENIDKI